MASSQCRLMEAHDKRNLIEISTLIDLTDKPIGLTRNEIGWSKVRANASNCICCCCNNSITLVSREDSYIPEHIPLDNIQFAQTNPSLQYLALSNHSKIAIIDLVDNNIKCNCAQNAASSTASTSPKLSSNVTKIVNLAAHGLTVNDVLFWRWIDDSALAILSYEALYTCSMNQQHINHPAYTALSNRSRYLMMEKVFETHQYLSAFCQVTDIHRDSSANLYAVSSLYSTSHNLLNQQPAAAAAAAAAATTTTVGGGGNSKTTFHQQHVDSLAQALHPRQSNSGKLLRPSFGSVPSRLSQLANNDHSFDSLKSEQLLFDRHHNRPTNRNQRQRHQSSAQSSPADEICGLVQIYCKLRNRSQLIQAHAITFTTPLYHHPLYALDLSQQRQQSTASYSGNKQYEPNNNSCLSHSQQQASPLATILVAANKIGAQMRVHFVEMATFDQFPSSGYQSASPTTKFNRLCDVDFPTSIVCSHVHSPNNQNYLHVALITTKHGQLYVCSVAHSTILFNVTITNDIISSTVLESSTQGLMVICRNGQVLLVKLILAKLMQLLDKSKTLRHISSSHNILASLESGSNAEHNNISIGDENNNNHNHKSSSGMPNDDDDGDDVDAKRGSSASTSFSSSSSSSSNNNNSQLSASLDTGLEVLSSTKL